MYNEYLKNIHIYSQNIYISRVIEGMLSLIKLKLNQNYNINRLRVFSNL